MHSCSLVQASTQMPTSLVVAAYERRCVRSTLERERRAASHQCAAREPPGPESRRGTMEHAQESTLADRRPQSGRQERAGDGRSKRPPSRAQGKNLCRTGLCPEPEPQQTVPSWAQPQATVLGDTSRQVAIKGSERARALHCKWFTGRLPQSSAGCVPPSTVASLGRVTSLGRGRRQRSVPSSCRKPCQTAPGSSAAPASRAPCR